MPENLQIRVSLGERVAILGMTGTGKTTLARELLRDVDRLVVLDAKGTLDNWGLEPWTEESKQRLEQGEPVRIRAEVDPEADAESVWSSLLRTAYYAREVFIYIDEAYLITDEGKRVERWLKAIWTTGREFGVSGIVSSQRPRWFPKFLLSESEHVFTFGLQLAEDREYAAQIIGEDARHWRTGEAMTTLERPPTKHGFFYFHAGGDAVYVPRLPRGSEAYQGDPVEIEVDDDDEY